jgi:tetratricopeptide (TPR) repeat protein
MEQYSRTAREKVVEENLRTVSELFFITTNILSEMIDAKDAYTEGHSERVRLLSVEIGRELGLSEKELAALSLAAKLHDIGKVKIEDSILKKRSGLTPEERSEIERHSIYSEDLLGRHPVIESVTEAIRSHHEFLDGNGYPDKLKGDAICELAKIISVADVFDALTSLRVYRECSYTDEEALELIIKGKGTKFDGRITDILQELYDNGIIDYCRGIYNLYKLPSEALRMFNSSLIRYRGDDIDKVYLMIGLIENILWNPTRAIEILKKGAGIRGKYYNRIRTEIAFSEYYMGRLSALYENYQWFLKHSDSISNVDLMRAYFGALIYFWKTRELDEAIHIVELLDNMFYNNKTDKELLNSDTLLIAIERKREIFNDIIMLQAKGYSIMGDIMYDLGEYSKAIRFYNNSISIKSIRGDLTGRAMSLLGSAKAFLKMGRTNDAKIRAVNSYRTNAEKEDKYGMFLTSLVLVQIYLEEEDFANARNYLNMADELKAHSKKKGDHYRYYVVKWLYELETEESSNIVHEIEEILSRDDINEFIEAECYYCLGWACEETDPAGSMKNYRKALKLFEKIRMIPKISMVKKRMR